MQTFKISDKILLEGTRITSAGARGAELLIPAAGGGASLPILKTCAERYIIFYVEVLEDHSAVFNLNVNSILDSAGDRAFLVRFGIMPGVRTLVCLDMNWLDAHILFPEHTPGMLKIVCHGGRVKKDEIDSVTLTTHPCFHDVKVVLSDITLTDERPESYPLPDIKLVDELGQYKLKDWPQKIRGTDELKERLQKAMETPNAFSSANWDEYGGCARMRIGEGTGYFTKTKRDGRWYLLDPLGNAFFSMGPDGVVARADCRVDEIEKFLTWLPDRDDPAYKSMFATGIRHARDPDYVREPLLFSFLQSNLYRAFGDGWYEKWMRLIGANLRQSNLNTLGNWSDSRLYGSMKMPYVTMLPAFPTTDTTIFRDFPDVFSDEYKGSAEQCAAFLSQYAGDPYMVGYFLRNEPAWAFVDNLVIADEVLYNPDDSACKRKLIRWLTDKYGTAAALSVAWNRAFTSFDDLESPIYAASRLSDASLTDLKAFSRLMLNEYVSVPSKACRAVDPDHMNLGMRWAWISDPDIITGWENFDVFSINNYSIDPTPALDNVVRLGVDLPVIIGEFHFGALDTGLTATGLEGVLTQEERGIAYRHYCERAAAHPYGVGCHFFQCYDQFALGRFDGENYNIGLFDICSQPNAVMLDAVRRCGAVIYEVMCGARPPVDIKPKSIPMIAY